MPERKIGENKSKIDLSLPTTCQTSLLKHVVMQNTRSWDACGIVTSPQTVPCMCNKGEDLVWNRFFFVGVFLDPYPQEWYRVKPHSQFKHRMRTLKSYSQYRYRPRSHAQPVQRRSTCYIGQTCLHTVGRPFMTIKLFVIM